MRVRLFVLLGILIVVILAVGLFLTTQLQRSAYEVRLDNTTLYAATMPAPAMLAGGLVDTTLRQDGDEALQPAEVGRVLLMNATLSLVVDDVDARVERITALAQEYGGWVVSAQVSRSRQGDQTRVSSGTITVRVDASRLDEVLRLIKEGANEVSSESVSGQDVTQDYVDLSSRIANLEAAEVQLQQIMEDARRTEDVLSVYDELVRVRGEIESIRGRLNYYDEASSFSQVQVYLTPTPVIEPVEIAGWRPLETARNAFQALVDVVQSAADVAIALVVFVVPLLLVFGIPTWLILRRRRITRAA